MSKAQVIDSMLCSIEDDINAVMIINGIDFKLEFVCYETRSSYLLIATASNCDVISTIYYDDIKSFKVIEYRTGKPDFVKSVYFG